MGFSARSALGVELVRGDLWGRCFRGLWGVGVSLGEAIGEIHACQAGIQSYLFRRVFEPSWHPAQSHLLRRYDWILREGVAVPLAWEILQVESALFVAICRWLVGPLWTKGSDRWNASTAEMASFSSGLASLNHGVSADTPWD